MISIIFSSLCIALALIIYAIHHIRKAHLKALEDKRYNQEAEIEEAMSMYENGQESG
jgi:hypothetical protein